jgi:hypothetical protein
MRALTLVVAVMTLSACAHATQAPPAAGKPKDVVLATGLGEIRFGASRAEVAAHVSDELPGCNVQLKDRPEGSMVFGADGRLVLLWFDSPLRTPDGVNTGDPVAEVSQVYPGATKLTGKAGRFDGLLVKEGEHGYLFLHDGQTVQKAIAGYADYLDRLFNTGFGVC